MRNVQLAGVRPLHAGMFRRSGLLGVLALVLVLSLAACGGATSDPPAAPAATATTAPAGGGTTSDAPPATGSATEIQATLREWSIELSQPTVPAGPVHFVVTNMGRMAHNFTVTGSSGTLARTPNFGASAGAQTLDVTLTAGTYTIICSLPGHAEQGQKVQLVVK